MLSDDARQSMIAVLRAFPAQLAALVEGLSETELNTPFLKGEWSVRQIVHHLPDSHMNSFIRLKLILSEDHPMLKPYDQEVWARHADVERTPISASLFIITGLHERWANLFESLSDEQRARTGYHPENGDMTPDDLLTVYADHCKNHLEQIRRTLAAGRAQALQVPEERHADQQHDEREDG